jgi:hypothetical protein
MRLPNELKKRLLPPGRRPRRVLYGPAKGLTFELDFEHQLRFWLGLYETEIVPALRRFVTPGRYVYDVGADIGFQALTLARLSQVGVVAFEPRQSAFDAINRNLQLNPDLADYVHVVRCFVGAGDEPNEQTLDTFASEGRAPFLPDALLIDVDGAEVDVLRGAQRLLDLRHPDLIIETHSLQLERQCIEIVTASGYAVELVNQRRLFPDYRPTPHNRWLLATAGSSV